MPEQGFYDSRMLAAEIRGVMRGKRPMAKLLIVDDDEYIRYGTKIFDRSGGIVRIEIVGEARGGHEVYSLFEDNAPQIVLTDIRMPDGDGLEFIKLIPRERLGHAYYRAEWL